MAEETIDSAENLSNQNADLDQLAAQSDFLNPARIDQPIDPTLRWEDNFVNPTNFIKDNTAGISPNVPPSAINQLAQKGVISPGLAVANRVNQELNSLTDYSDYATPYAYDATPSGTFRDRYKAYGQETFNKLGFDPLIDNETWYNQNTTFGDDLKRWATHSAWPMFTKGIIDPIKSYKSIADGDGLFYADPEGARDYQYYNSLGQSTKGGLGGFTVNLLNSASYSMGILTEGAMEGALIGGLFGGPGGAARGALTGLRKLSNLPRAFKNLAKGTGKLLDDVNSYSNLSKAKEYWKKAGTNFGNFINPLQNTATALKNTSNLTNAARSTTTAGAFWHDVMAMNMALSEGKLEGGFTKNELYDKLYNQFLNDPKNNGKSPTLEQQEELMMEASKGSWWNTHNNTMLIYYTNKLVFPSITKASFLKGVPKFAFGKTVTNVGREYQVLFKPGQKGLQGEFVKEKINLINALKSLGKPKSYGKVGLNYFKANVMEGFQEVSQDILQESTQDYYLETFKNPNARNIRYGAGIVSDAIAKQWSSQGLETFMSGFLMGTILQAPGKIKTYATIGYNDYFKKGPKFEEYVSGRKEMADDIVKELNTLYKNANYFFDPRVSNHAQQGLMSKVIDNPEEHTTKEIQDTKFAAFQSALYASLERGTFDMFLNHLKKYQQASAKDIEEAWNLEPGQGQKALERFETSLKDAEKVAFRYNKAKDKMKEFRLDLNDYEKDTEEYRMAQVYNKAFSLALNSYTFLSSSFDNNLKRIDGLYNKFNKITSLSKTPMNNISALTDPNQLFRQIEMLKTDIETLESVPTQEAKIELSTKRELLELYSRYEANLDKTFNLFIDKIKLESKINEINKLELSEDEQEDLEMLNSILKDFEKTLSTGSESFKKTFNDLLIGLGNTNEDRFKIEKEINNQGGIDSLVDGVLDILILNNENGILNQYANLLSSPNGFYEHVVKNFEFMRKLYNNRENIVKDIVNQEITAIERNTLLNTLANQGVFLDLEEFNKWVEDHNYKPEFFIDVKTNRMINKGSLIYMDYIDILNRAAKLDEEKPAGETVGLKEQLDNKIAELEAERDGLIQKERDKYNKAFEDKYGMTPSQYESEEAQRVAGETLTEDRKAELEADKKKLEDAIKVFEESINNGEINAAVLVVVEQVMKKDNIDGEKYLLEQEQIIINDSQKLNAFRKLSIKFQSEDRDQQANSTILTLVFGEWSTNKLKEINEELSKEPATAQINVEDTNEYKKFQEAVDAIIAKYDALIAEIKAEFDKQGVNENTPKVYTTKTEFDNFDQEFQNEITKLFDDYLVNTIEESIDLKVNDPIKYENLRKNWLESQSDLINNFNTKSQLNAEEKAKRLAEPPKLKFINKQIGINNSTYEIGQVIKRFEKFLKDGGYPSRDGKKTVPLTDQNIKDINDDLVALKGYLNARVESSIPKTVAEETVNIIIDNVINKQDELEDIYDEDGNKIGRKFKDSETVPERTTKVAEQVENKIKGNEAFIYQGLAPRVDKTTGEPKKSQIRELYDLTYGNPDVAAVDKVEKFMEAFTQKVETTGTTENPGFPAFKYVEKMNAVRNSLETDGSYEALEKVISREAFRESSDSGNVVDDLIRMFLTPNAATKSKFTEFTYDSEVEIKGRMSKISDLMSKKAFDKLFAPITVNSSGGIVTKFRLGVVDGSYTIFSEDVKVFDKNLRENGVTGELDLLLIKEDGSVAIVDIKTSSEAKWKKFGTEKGYEKSTYFRAQQSIYGYMFYNSTGILPELKLMPLSLTLSKDRNVKVGYIEDVDLAGIVPDAQDTIDLEYLPEIEDFGIIKIEPENVTVRTTTESTSKPGYQATEPSKITLGDNIGKFVIYKGKEGKLIRTKNGEFAIEVSTNTDLTALQISLDTAKANRALLIKGTQEGTYVVGGLNEINDQIEKLEESISSQQNLIEVFPIRRLDSTSDIVNEKLTLEDVGLQVIAPVESIGQVSIIQGEVINASFSNQNETVASINGVRYDINRSQSGEIISLSYMSNDAEIGKIDKKIGEIGNKIGLLKNNFEKETDEVKRNLILTRISDLRLEIQDLSSRRESLYDSNQKTFVYGVNADNYIFALNRLPNNFQRLTSKVNKLDEIQDLKEIDRLSLSTNISIAITEILAEQYPEALDRLLDGKSQSLNSKDLLNVQLWIEDTVEQLYELGYTVLNRGDLTDDIENQIFALLQLQNDLKLIKLTKDGKIHNYKQIEKEFTGKRKVQKRTSVPKNEGTVSGQSESVPGQSSGTSFQEIIKRSRETSDFEFTPGAEKPTQTDSTKSNIDELLQKISNAKLNDIQEVYEAAVLKALENGEAKAISSLQEAYNTRLTELNTLVSLDTINIGEHLISKNPIFEDAAESIYRIVRINKSSVRLENIISEVKDTINQEELVNLEKTTMEATKPVSETPIDPVDIEGSNESQDIVKDLANDTKSTSKFKEDSRNSDVNSRFDNLKNNSKEC